jgi:hypothetical protein
MSTGGRPAMHMARKRLAASMARWALHPTAGFALTSDPSAFLVFGPRRGTGPPLPTAHGTGRVAP